MIDKFTLDIYNQKSQSIKSKSDENIKKKKKRKK